MPEVLRKSIVNLYGIPYEVDLERCRIAMLDRLVALRSAGQDGPGMELIAEAAGVNPATVARFLKGRDTKPQNFVAIVTRGFGLEVADVAKPVEIAV